MKAIESFQGEKRPFLPFVKLLPIHRSGISINQTR